MQTLRYHQFGVAVLQLIIFFAVFASTSHASQTPAWWINSAAFQPNVAPVESAIATQGQVMWMAKKAKTSMDLIYAAHGGAGAEVDQLFVDYNLNGGADAKNLKIINQGQLKYVASKFWKRLQLLASPLVAPPPPFALH